MNIAEDMEHYQLNLFDAGASESEHSSGLRAEKVGADGGKIENCDHRSGGDASKRVINAVAITEMPRHL